MPYKFETDKLHLPESKDRRVKLTKAQKDLIRMEYVLGKGSLKSLAARYNVSKKTILLITNPNSKKKNDDYIKSNWKNYQTHGEEHAKDMRDHRHYKKKIYDKGELI